MELTGQALYLLTDDISEKSVLACLFLQPSLFEEMQDGPYSTPSLFVVPQNRLIYLALYHVYARDKNAQFLNIRDLYDVLHSGVLEVEKRDEQVQVDHEYLVEVLLFTSDVLEFSSSYSRLCRLYYQRLHAERAADLKQAILNGNIEQIDQLTQLEIDNPFTSYTDEFQSFEGLIDKANAVVEERQEKGDGIIGVPMPYEEINNVMGGIPYGAVTVLVGHAGNGKTWLSLSIAEYASRLSIPTDFYALETKGEELIYRMNSVISGVDTDKIRRGLMNEHELKEYHRANDLLKQRTFTINDNPDVTVNGLVKRIKYRIKTNGTKFVVLDYGQLVNLDVGEENLGIVHLSNRLLMSLRVVANVYNVAILILANTKSEATMKREKRPTTDDALGGSAWKREPAIVISCFVPSLYSDDEEVTNIGEIAIIKNRFGRLVTSRVPMSNGQYLPMLLEEHREEVREQLDNDEGFLF